MSNILPIVYLSTIEIYNQGKQSALKN